MLTLDLDKLFSPRMLQAFRESWGVLPMDADRLAQKIASIFEEKKGSGRAPASQARRQAWLRTVISALVGPEPDFEAWVETLARGSFDVRPNATFARTPGTESPSRFLLRQRQRIDTLVNQDLPPQEQELHRRAYLDAQRQILVSLIIREMKRAVTANRAVGTAWPLMMASRDHMSEADQALLHHFGGDRQFLAHLGATVAAAIESWIREHHGGEAPEVAKTAYLDKLPPGVRRRDALVQVDRLTAAIDEYREALWRELGLEDDPEPGAGDCPLPQNLAVKDAIVIRTAHCSSAGGYRHFTEANGGDEVFAYEDSDLDRLLEYLPIMASEYASSPAVKYARSRAQRRAELRRENPGLYADHDLQEEIARWVDAGHPPPAKLKKHHAAYFEEEVCRVYVEGLAGSQWLGTSFTLPGCLPF